MAQICLFRSTSFKTRGRWLQLCSRHQLTILKFSSREEPPQLEPDTSELLQTVVQIPRRDYVPWGPVRKRICVPLRRANQRPGRTLTFSMLLCIYRYTRAVPVLRTVEVFWRSVIFFVSLTGQSLVWLSPRSPSVLGASTRAPHSGVTYSQRRRVTNFISHWFFLNINSN